MKKVYFIVVLLAVIALVAGCVSVPAVNENANELEQNASEESNNLLDGAKTVDCEDQDSGASMSVEEALEIANNSPCVQEGAIHEDCNCNEGTGTCWLDMTVEGHEGCNPACVVNVETGEAEVNWRCTGLIVE